jgi:hypothetical protein
MSNDFKMLFMGTSTLNRDSLLGETDRAFDWLEKAAEEHDG